MMHFPIIKKEEGPRFIPKDVERVFSCNRCASQYPTENAFCPWCKSTRRMIVNKRTAETLALEKLYDSTLLEIKFQDLVDAGILNVKEVSNDREI